MVQKPHQTPATGPTDRQHETPALEKALGLARAAETYLRGVVEECELVRQIPSFGDPEQLRERLQIALDAVEHRADALAEQGQTPAADEIRLSAKHTVNDLVVRDWAEHARRDLLQQWQAGDIGRDRAMTALRFAYAADASTPQTGRVALRGSAAELLQAYLDAQFDRPARRDPGQNMLPEFEARTDRGAPDATPDKTTWPPEPTRESLQRTRDAIRGLPEYPSNAELERVGVSFVEYAQLTAVDQAMDRLLEDGRDIGIAGVPHEDFLYLEKDEDLEAEVDYDI